MSFRVLEHYRHLAAAAGERLDLVSSVWPQDGNRGRWWVHALNLVNPFFRLRDKAALSYFGISLDTRKAHYLVMSNEGETELLDHQEFMLDAISDVQIAREELFYMITFQYLGRSFRFKLAEYLVGSYAFSEDEQAQSSLMADAIASLLAQRRAAA